MYRLAQNSIQDPLFHRLDEEFVQIGVDSIVNNAILKLSSVSQSFIPSYRYSRDGLTLEIPSEMNQPGIYYLTNDTDSIGVLAYNCSLSESDIHAYSNEEWKSVLSYNYERSIITQSFSKSHSMTGYRIGYLVSNETIINKLTKLQALSLTNVSEPIQFTAMNSLDDDVSYNGKIMKQRLSKLEEICNEMKLEFVHPDGAMYIFARTKDAINTSDLAEELLKYGLAIAPGIGFGDYNEFFRVSACLDEKTLIQGMDILKTRL
mgnify:CR=1 FL=1